MRSRVLLALAFLASILLPSVVAAAPARSADASVAPAAATELMRLTNLDREANGLPALAIDPTLEALASDRSFACPSGLHPAGRALDMAARDYFAHVIPGCARTGSAGITLIDLLPSMGYNTDRGENIAWNDGAGTGPAMYTPGCDLSGADCRGASTASVADVAMAEHQFITSPEHRANILGHYDRFGCGAARASGDQLYVACLFSLGGPAPRTYAARQAGPGPVFVHVLDTPSRILADRFHEFAVQVRDMSGLRSLTLVLDGRTLRRCALSGHVTARYDVVPGRLLRPGRHVLRWTVTGTSGRSETITRSFIAG